MHRNWKSVAALGMAAVLGCLMPANTMLAAEEDTEAVQELEADSVTDADEVSDDEAISDDNEIVDEEENAVDKKAGDEEKTDDEDAADAEDETVDAVEDEIVIDEADTDNDGNEGIQVMSVTEEPQAGGAAVQANADAPVIDIKFQGQSYKYDLGGKIDYKYVNNRNQQFEFSASQQNESSVKIYYYLDRVEDITAEAKSAESIESWMGPQNDSMTMVLEDDKNYVLYVKAVSADEQTVYARSGGIVVDTEAPKVTGVADGGTYQEGTTFHVEDPNLESVTVNGKSMTLASDGNYQVTADDTSYKIEAKDKAGNETIFNITVTARELEAGGVVTVNGTYALKPGVPYQLAEGQWQISGDGTVYQGGSTFYVMISDNYRFTKR